VRETTIRAGDKVSTLPHALPSRINIITLPCVAVVFIHIPIHINKHPIYTYTNMENYHLFLYHYKIPKNTKNTEAQAYSV
jgi:hypothetical protein